MKYYLINCIGDKEEVTRFDIIDFLTDRQLTLLRKFEESNKQQVKFKINENINLVYSYVVVEK